MTFGLSRLAVPLNLFEKQASPLSEYQFSGAQ